MKPVVFLGGGRITSALVAGLRLSDKGHKLIVYDRNPAKLQSLQRAYRVGVEEDLQRAVQRADLLIVAVRPNSVRELLQGMGTINKPILMVSLAAGVPLRDLCASLGYPVRWARAMPSPVGRSGHGLTALTFPRGLSKQDRKSVRDFFSVTGTVVEIPESKFDAFTVAYSSSHGYHALATLSKAAEGLGLDRQTALLASAHALADGIQAWRDSKHSLRAVLEEAATPGGIAATTMAAMDAAGYASSIGTGLRAGLQRARANARK